MTDTLGLFFVRRLSVRLSVRHTFFGRFLGSLRFFVGFDVGSSVFLVLNLFSKFECGRVLLWGVEHFTVKSDYANSAPLLRNW